MEGPPTSPLRPVSIKVGPSRPRRESLVGNVETFGLFIHSQSAPRLDEADDDDDDDDKSEEGARPVEPAPPVRASRRLSSRLASLLSVTSDGAPARRSSLRLSLAKPWKSEQQLPTSPSRQGSLVAMTIAREGSSTPTQQHRSPSSFSLKSTLSSTSLEAVYGPERAPASFEVDPMKDTQRLVLEHMESRARASSRDPTAIDREIHRLAVPRHQAERLRKSMSERPRSISLKPSHNINTTSALPA